MSISNEKIVATMRQMAWERAKGELRSMYGTFWPSFSSGTSVKDESNFEEFTAEVEKFIEHIEDNGLQE